MVRRWSYINSLPENNLVVNSSCELFKKMNHLRTFRDTTHFKRFFFGDFKHKRRRFGRKGRWSHGLVNFSILGLWAKEYKFFKTYSRYQTFNRFFTSSFVFHDFFFYKNYIKVYDSADFSFLTTSYSKKIYFYYLSRFSHFSHLKNLNGFVPNYLFTKSSTFIPITPTSDLISNKSNKVLALYDNTALYSLPPYTNLFTIPLFGGIFVIFHEKLKEVYKTLIYLNLFSISS